MQKKTCPDFVPPMMAHSVKEPFDSRDWIFELKLDGYRAITVFDAAGKPHLWSRNRLPLEQKFDAGGHAQKTAQENRITSALWERFRNFATSRKTQLGFIVFDCVTCQVGDFLYYPPAILR